MEQQEEPLSTYCIQLSVSNRDTHLPVIYSKFYSHTGRFHSLEVSGDVSNILRGVIKL